MDVDDEALFVEWEADTIFSNFPDGSYLYSPRDNSESSQENEVSSEEKNYYGQMDNDLDYAIAMSLQKKFNDEVKENENTDLMKWEASKLLSIVDEQWELIDPHPDIHALFVEYDEKFFYGKLKSIEVRWSSRMTLCAGICSYQGKGGLCSIGLSAPLLKLRPRRDLVETLLHEMIHAYLFVTENNKDREGHGPEFLSHMHRINKEAGTRITVYHSFHAEVNLYKQHWWKCEGSCRYRPPYFGLVKRVMNRAPGPNDSWWAAHQLSCGGKFIKIKEPSNFSEKKILKKRLQSDSKLKPSDIRKYIKVGNPEHSKKESSHPKVVDIESPPEKNTLDAINVAETLKKENFIPFQGTCHKLGSSGALQESFPSLNLKDLHFECKKHLSSSSFRNAESKGAFSPGSPGKALIKRDLSSNSIRKTLTQRDLHSNSKGKAASKKGLYSFLGKVPGHDFSASASSDKTKKSDTNVVKNSLLPQNYTESVQESCVPGVNFSSSVSSKLCCPVCSDLVREEINAHLDKCLKSSTVESSN